MSVKGRIEVSMTVVGAVDIEIVDEETFIVSNPARTERTPMKAELVVIAGSKKDLADVTRWGEGSAGNDWFRAAYEQVLLRTAAAVKSSDTESVTVAVGGGKIGEA